MDDRDYNASSKKQVTLKLLGYDYGPGRDAPFWLRPFFSLRAQLLLAYHMLLSLLVLVICLLVYQQTSRLVILLIALIALVIGALAFIATTQLLRPLWRVIDAAQAIAVGDLQQRERLPLRLPPQDDVDRLAGSIDEMVTRLERAEELKRVSEDSFKRFFSDASHQLRTPLTSIRGFTEILMRGAIDDQETRRRVLTRMKSEAERMTFLINDILTLARLNDSHLLKIQYVDLVEVAVEAVRQARLQSNDGCTISLDLPTDARLGVQADQERLNQLLFILLDNALKHGRPAPDGVITLQLGKEGEQAVMRIIDNGEGIASEDLEHIFDSFYRGRHSPPRDVPVMGTGLGLTIANAIIQAHHGAISVTSEQGKGTEFVVTLPYVG